MNKRRANAAVLAALLAMTVGTGAARADKPDWAGQGKDKSRPGQGRDSGARQGKDRPGNGQARPVGQQQPARRAGAVAPREPRVGGYFDERDRRTAHVWYDDHYGGRKGCPPGLAKKNNGCLPPGQARKYAIGRPLPAGVVMYPVPAAIVVQLPPAPRGHKYVRVAADILLIAVGTSMVVDAITDLGRL